MSIHLKWEKSKLPILRQTFELGWTLQAYAHSLEAIYSMTVCVTPQARLLMDLRAANKPAHAVGKPHRLKDVELTRHLAEVVIVMPGYFLPHFGCPFIVFETMESAQQHLDPPVSNGFLFEDRLAG